ncbi:unnamed protein product [Adineta ricciae]|uniref:Hint domain-containing protein n=1 Tax=Adineta ricciae TaxID=249248 RepID=A0A815QCJ2_ADIRI|nr:unnamed protein product [Adineta ricciae]
MTCVDKLVFISIILSGWIFIVVIAPVPEFNETSKNDTNSNQTKSLVCVGVCPNVEIHVIPSSWKCFSADSWLQLRDGSKQNIGKIRSGDTLWGFNGTDAVFSEMILMLDKSVYKKAVFYTLETESNHTISLTAEHLIPIVFDNNKFTYIPAMNIKINRDSLCQSKRKLATLHH